ncbi:hypothetical protein [Kribbella sp. CA-294648]|uniref:hypothetical protein n=1 Tax=Kribbella sp. CA-294648 TaxID=3239948 RepID=UPI003D9156B6
MELGVVHTWGAGPEVVFLSNPLADPVSWSAGVRDELLKLGYRVTTFEHRPAELDVELPGAAHAAPLTDPSDVWPPVVDFLQRHHPPR